MANRLKVAQQQAMIALAQRGWSCRRIAREPGVHRETVALYVRRAAGANPPRPAIPITGSQAPRPTIVIPGSPGQRSRCEPLRDVIIGMLEQGLSAQRILQDLTAEHDFSASYASVQRFVGELSE